MVFTLDVFATTNSATGAISSETLSSESTIIVLNSNTGSATTEDETSVVPEETTDKKSTVKQETVDETSAAKQEIEDKKKEREKTINDINTFLIESYKLKIDRILANLNISLERVTNNNPVAQTKLLEKIRGDINTKIQVINTHSISENRKKILSSIFSYIQENLDAKISKLVGQK